MSEDLEVLERIDILEDAVDILEAFDPIAAIVEVATEEVLVSPLLDFLDRLD